MDPTDKVLGRLFPIRVLLKYKSLSRQAGDGEDPCDASKRELRRFQKFVSRYFSEEPVRGLLVYHGTGTGKTATTVAAVGSLFRLHGVANVVVLFPGSFDAEGWAAEARKWSSELTNFTFVSYNTSSTRREYDEFVLKSDATKPTVAVIDESHNFFSNVLTNLGSPKKTGRAHYVYADLLRRQARVLCLSATPLKRRPFELCLMFNLLRPGSLPPTKSAFDAKFVTEKGGLSASKKSLLQQRIQGLVSYYAGHESDGLATKEVATVECPMSRQQAEAYDAAAAIDRLKRPNLTRLVSNFALPGVKRPRDPSRNPAYLSRAAAAVRAAGKVAAAPASVADLWSAEGGEGALGTLRALSSKMTAAALLLRNSPGPGMLYSQYVQLEGLEIARLFLDAFGVSHVEYHGGVPPEDRARALAAFNAGAAKAILVSAAGSEGMSLKNVRTVVVLEPSWNEDNVEQAVGRAVRQCSHKDLPPEQRVVSVHRLVATHPSRPVAADQVVARHARKRKEAKEGFLQAVREAAVDCHLFRRWNRQEYCYSLPPEVLERPGPAFRTNVEEDDRLGEGSVVATKVRVLEIVYVVGKKERKGLLDEVTGFVYDPDLHVPVGKLERVEEGFRRTVEGQFVLDPFGDKRQ